MVYCLLMLITVIVNGLHKYICIVYLGHEHIKYLKISLDQSFDITLALMELYPGYVHMFFICTECMCLQTGICIHI